MFTSIEFHKTKQVRHSYAGYNKKNDASYMVVSQPMFEYVHKKYLRNITKKQKSKNSRLKKR